VLQLTNEDRLGIARELASRSFASYMKMSWPVFEPAMPYIHGWHMDCIGEHLEAAADGQISRLLITVPPGTSKSTAVGIVFPSWLWGPKGRPWFRYIGASHDQDLAVRDNRKTRLLVESEWYQQHWPLKLVGDQNEKKFFENKASGFRQAVAVKSMTGRRGHAVVLDDPLSPEKAYSELDRETAIRVFKETVPSRLVDPKKSIIVVIMQRLHEQDVAGHILESDYGYVHVMLPMEFEADRRCYTVVKPRFMQAEPVLARYQARTGRWFVDGQPVPPEVADEVLARPVERVYPQDPRTEEGELLLPARFPREVVDRDKHVLGEFGAAGQLQQRPAPRGGGMFPVDRFELCKEPVPESWVIQRVRYWDKAGTADAGAYTAGVRMARLKDGRFVVEHVWRKQVGALDRERKILELAQSDPAGTAVWIEQEPGSGGKESAQRTVANLAGFSVYVDRVTGSKEHRAAPYAAQVQGGNVLIYAGQWVQPFKDEHESFPAGRYKDQVDAAAGAFAKLNNSKRGGVLW
jgi:predicted phage terminase large subunit-like protein